MKISNYIKILLVLCFVTAKAQVGINTTNPYSSLDVRSSNQATPSNTDGLLVPKVDTFPVTSPTALQQGMLVFLTTASGSSPAGFYYWNNPTGSWVAVGSALTNDWSISGNTNTTPGTHFLGTTDNKDIVFKRFNVQSGFIGDPNTTTGNMNTSFGANGLAAAGTGTRNTVVGANALRANTTGSTNVAIGERSLYLNTQGTSNVALGVGALYSNSTANSNTALGRNALTSNTLGAFNTATGRDAVYSNTEGTQNTGTGVNSLYYNTLGNYNTGDGVQALRSNNTGNNNTGLGFQAGYSNATGHNNTFLGNQAGYTTTGGDNIFIGNQAGYNETGSNKLYISNTNADAVNALVYGEFTSSPKVLRTNAQLQIGDPAGTGYKMPTARGTAGQTLETDGTGNVSWTNGVNKLSAIRVNLTGNQFYAATGWQKLPFNGVVFDTNSEFDTAQNRFVAQRAGYYRITAGYHTDNQPNTSFYSIGVRVNGTTYYQETSSKHHGVDIVSRQVSCIVKLNPGEYVEIFENNNQGSITIDGYSGKTFFEIEQIRGL